MLNAAAAPSHQFRADHAAQSVPARVSLASFEENGVAVGIFFESVAPGKGRLDGTFTPLEAELHLYSKDLPKHGIRGLGRPTLLEIISPPSLKSRGALVASRPATERFVAALGAKLPVYPDGAVTLSLPVSTGRNGPVTGELSVTYMACSDRVCLAPVVDERISVKIPATVTQ